MPQLFIEEELETLESQSIFGAGLSLSLSLRTVSHSGLSQKWIIIEKIMFEIILGKADKTLN